MNSRSPTPARGHRPLRPWATRIAAAHASALAALGFAIGGAAHAQTQPPATAPSPAAWPVVAPPTQGLASLQLWHAAARDAIARQRPNQQAALRLLAMLALAQHQAADMLGSAPAGDAAWQALFDAASAPVLAGLLPAEAATFTRLAEALAAQRGSERDAADVVRAQSAGERAAQAVLGRAASDGFDAVWRGSLPTQDGRWHSLVEPARAPHLPALGAVQPIFLRTGDALRPPAPPATDSAAFARATAEVKARASSADPQALSRAKRWEMTHASLVAGFWDDAALRLAAQQGLPGRATARMMAATLGATWDANIACHDAKYTYWVPRPSQVDPTIKPLIAVPNHPSYPSNHACDSGAAARVLASYFPAHRDHLQALAREAAESRIDGGIHYRFDMDAGLAIGDGAAAAALAVAGPQPTLVGAAGVAP